MDEWRKQMVNSRRDPYFAFGRGHCISMFVDGWDLTWRITYMYRATKYGSIEDANFRLEMTEQIPSAWIFG